MITFSGGEDDHLLDVWLPGEWDSGHCFTLQVQLLRRQLPLLDLHQTCTNTHTWIHHHAEVGVKCVVEVLQY